MPANELMAEIHNAKRRMPAILRPEDIDTWLAGSPADATAALKQYPSGDMVAWPVSARVNNVRNDGPDLIRQWRAESPAQSAV